MCDDPLARSRLPSLPISGASAGIAAGSRKPIQGEVDHEKLGIERDLQQVTVEDFQMYLFGKENDYTYVHLGRVATEAEMRAQKPKLRTLHVCPSGAPNVARIRWGENISEERFLEPAFRLKPGLIAQQGCYLRWLSSRVPLETFRCVRDTMPYSFRRRDSRRPRGTRGNTASRKSWPEI